MHAKQNVKHERFTCFVCGFLLKGGLGSILVDFVLLATTIGSVVLRVIL